MLTRIYIDNYKCFSNLELSLGPMGLLLGDNGTGKSSVLDVIAGLQALSLGDPLSRSGLGGTTLTRWDKRTRQTFELDVQSADLSVLKYRLELEVEPQHGFTTISHESLTYEGQSLYRNDGGKAEILVAGGTMQVLVDRVRSGISMVPTKSVGMARFQEVMQRLIVLRPSPSGMAAASNQEEERLARHGSNFSAWYRGLDPQQLFETKQTLHQHLRDVLSGFQSLRFHKTGGSERVLQTLWTAEVDSATSQFELGFDELSDGQRMLVVLYTLLSLSAAGAPLTVLLDEPTNYVSLAEIEPWLGELEEQTERGLLQVLIASHHPELLNAWAVTHGVRFSRRAAGPVRAERFGSHEDDLLTPAERIARGWDDDGDAQG